MRGAWLLVAELVKWLHIFFMLAVVISPLFPVVWGFRGLLAQVSMVSVLFGMQFLDRRRRCPVTLLEAWLRRRGGDWLPVRGLTRRLLETVLGHDVPSRMAAGVAYGVAGEALVIGILLSLLYG